MLILDHKLSHREIEQMVFQEYDFYPNKVESIGNVKKISCERGVFAFKRTSASIEQLELITEWISSLMEKGFRHLIPFYPNKYGDPFIRLEDVAYYVTPWIEEQTEHKYKDTWENEMLEALGRLHHLSEGMQLYVNKRNISYLSLHRILERWKQRLEQLKDMQSLAKSRALMSTIETSFINHYQYLESIAKKSIDYLEKWISSFDEEQQRLVLCLGNLHRQHVIHDDQTYYFIRI